MHFQATVFVFAPDMSIASIVLISSQAPGNKARGTLNETVDIMKLIKKTALLLILGSLGAHAYAADNAEATDNTAATATPTETYNYSTKLDIKHVIATTDAADACAPVPVQMTYDDSYGKRHVMQYQVMGNGCTN
jgi:hypothetical protein